MNVTMNLRPSVLRFGCSQMMDRPLNDTDADHSVSPRVLKEIARSPVKRDSYIDGILAEFNGDEVMDVDDIDYCEEEYPIVFIDEEVEDERSYNEHLLGSTWDRRSDDV